MLKQTLSRFLSLLTTFAMLLSSFPSNVTAAPAAAPDFIKVLTPPPALGYIENFYKGQTEHPVILIQDLHANYGVQKKIRSLLEFLHPKAAPTGRPMVLGVEGAWGDLDLTSIQREGGKELSPAMDFLLKESEVSGMDHYAVLTDKPVHMVGIDNPQDYILHTELFRKSLAARLALAKKTDQLRQVISDSKVKAPANLRRLWKMEEAFHAGEMDLTELSKKLNVSLANYGAAEKALAEKKAALANQEKGENGFFVRNVVQADQNLALLGRLLRQQLTYEEVQYAGKQISSILVTVQALMPGESLALWKDTIQSAIDHYAVALMRNKPMALNALELVQKNADTSVIIVAGGFHTAGITSYFKERKTSYVIISPIVESHTVRDEEVYVKRMLDLHVTDKEITSSAQAVPNAQTMMIMSAVPAWILNPATYQRSHGLLRRTLAAFRGRSAAPTTATERAQSDAVAQLFAAPNTNGVSTASWLPAVLARPIIAVKTLLGRDRQVVLTPMVNNNDQPVDTAAQVSVTAVASRDRDAKGPSFWQQTKDGARALATRRNAKVAGAVVGAVAIGLALASVAMTGDHSGAAHVVDAATNSSPLAAGMMGMGIFRTGKNKKAKTAEETPEQRLGRIRRMLIRAAA